MEKTIDGLLNAVWSVHENELGLKVRSLVPIGYEIETGEGTFSLTDLFDPFYDSDKTAFVVVNIRREDKDGNPF